MKIVVCVYVDELEKKLNRTIVVDKNISLSDFCEIINISLGNIYSPLYILKYKNNLYSLYDFETKNINDYKLNDLNLKIADEMNLIYDETNCYNFVINVVDILNTNIYKDNQVIDGIGYGVLPKEDSISLYRILNYSSEQIEKYCTKTQKEFLTKKFDIDDCNQKIEEYLKIKKEINKPKSYILNISLDGFNKEIKRKIIVNNNLSINTFCRMVIASFKGDLSHLYGIKINKYFIEGEYKNLSLYHLHLNDKQKFSVIYDYGDNWCFKVSVSKIIDGYSEMKVISGKGYGIVDDCGGVWGLYDIFYGEDNLNEYGEGWEHHDINDFNLDMCNVDVMEEL